ncbi:MAG TPA: hypothetical protein VD793_04625 [Gemmatimonadales bacterium]|nr:hypothetical protein [Gemmatimonadales bacterium]
MPAAVAVFFLTACAHTFDAQTLGANVTLASGPGGQPCATPFRQSTKAVFLLWGMIPASRPNLQNVLAAQITGTAEVRDLRIAVRSRFTDLLFTAISAGLVVPRSVTFEGCVVQ